MASDENSLRALETLMNEFFFGTTSNERKREIELLLNNFSQHKDSWQHCLYYLTNTSNEYVMMYCCTVTETVINKRWVGFPTENKATIRSIIGKFLLSEHKNVPTFIRNKLCKLIVDIGRIDWPHFYPDFLSNTLHLVQQPDTTILGLIMLQTTSEELACPRDDLSTGRKEELHRLLIEHIPNILSILAGLLEANLDKRQLVTATPPPSPTHCGEDQTGESQQTLFSTSPLHHGSLLSSMFKSLNNKGLFKKCPDVLSKECHELCTLTLSCLSHFFSWIPLSDYITPNLLTTVFHLASFGCHPSGNNKVSGRLYPTQAKAENNHASIGILAMCCINEIMSKNCVPSEFEDFLLQMFQYTFHLLQCLTKDNSQLNHENHAVNSMVQHNGSHYGNIWSELDECYIEKFTEFLRLFVCVHFRRFESNNQFPVLEFLALLFKYTFQQPSNEGFFNCLDIWAVFIDYLATKLQDRSTDSALIIQRYRDALTSLVQHVVRKYLFKFNQLQLEELDDDSFDDNNETDWQHFLRQCIETVARVSDLLPIDSYNIIEPLFEENSDLYFSLQSYLESVMLSSPSKCAGLNNENECRRLHCVLRDLSSVLQTMGRFSEHFTGENFWKRFVVAKRIVRKLCDIVIFSSKIQCFYNNCSVPKVLRSDFIEVHAQALAALKAYTHWLAQYYLDSLKESQLKDDVNSIIESILNSAIAVIDANLPNKISHSGAHLLMSITLTVRPTFMLRFSSIQSLFSIQRFRNLGLETQLLVYRSISNILLLTPPNGHQEEFQWEERVAMHSKFIQSITPIFVQIQNTAGFADDKQAQEAAIPEIKWTLKVLLDLVESNGTSVTKTKQFLYQNIHEPVNMTLQLFSIYTHSNDVTEDILSVFLVLFDCLRVQIGVQFSERIITNFMEIFTRDQLTKNILQGDNSGTRVIEKFLKILQLIVQEPGSAFKMFLPCTIKLCINQIYPIVAQRSSPDVKLPLFELLHSILLYNWKYFFKSSVLTTLGKPGNESISNQDQFISIMQAFGQSFLQPDINIFKQNLAALDNLNSKWKLYHKTLFKEVMLHQFLKVLIQALVHKSHDLLQEEIGISIYNMASVDFGGFYRVFIPHVLSECDDINEEQRNILAKNFQSETDLPTFMKNLHRFIGDLRHYELCNRSLPSGPVSF